jgi:hypothetical protein
MVDKTLMSEKDGQSLKADYFTVDGGTGVRFFINGEFIKEEIYEGKNIHFAQSAAENWIAGIKTLNG